MLKLLLDTELEMGRVRLRHWGERNIDLDLLLYDDLIYYSEKLVLPHPDMQNRLFGTAAAVRNCCRIKYTLFIKKSIQNLLKSLTDGDE